MYENVVRTETKGEEHNRRPSPPPSSPSGLAIMGREVQIDRMANPPSARAAAWDPTSTGQPWTSKVLLLDAQ